jgi:hypothetical protein
VLVNKVARAMPGASQIAEAPAAAPTGRANLKPAARAKTARAAPVQPAMTTARSPMIAPAKISPALAPAGITAPTTVAPAAKIASAVPPSAPSNGTPAPQGLFSPHRTAAVAPAIPMPPLADAVSPLLFEQSRITAMAALDAAQPKAPRALAAGAQPAFLDLFSTDGRGAVSRVVSELWGVRPASAKPPIAVVTPPADARGPEATDQGRGLDFFRSTRPRT